MASKAGIGIVTKALGFEEEEKGVASVAGRAGFVISLEGVAVPTLVSDDSPVW